MEKIDKSINESGWYTQSLCGYNRLNKYKFFEGFYTVDISPLLYASFS